MTKKQYLELILNTSGFEMRDFTLIRDASCYAGYDFTAYKNDLFLFRVSTDSFNGAVSDTLEQIYQLENINFSPIFNQ